MPKRPDSLRTSADQKHGRLVYRSAHADSLEVLLTRRDSLDAELELVEAKVNQLRARGGVYQALGGGWLPDGRLRCGSPTTGDPKGPRTLRP